MLRAIIFDFNGVVVNDEPLHYRMFQRVFDEERIPFSEEGYYARYLPMDDHTLVRSLFRDLDRPLSAAEEARLVGKKEAYYRETMRAGGVEFFPGVKEFIRRCAQMVPLAIASGAAREEIEFLLASAELRPHFRAIVAAEDVTKGKPDPEIFLKALEALRSARRPGEGDVLAPDTLVIEDSPAGVRGARAAGMRCLAVLHSVSADRLSEANRVVPTLANLDPRTLDW